MLGKWDSFYRGVKDTFPYGGVESYVRAISFLDDGCQMIQDWGCGVAFAKTLVKKAQYLGVDGSWSPMADVIVDLREFRCETDGILLRHVLEHNYDWKKVLENALASFRKKLVIVLFTPFSETTREIAMNDIGVPDISFRKDDLLEYLSGMRWSEESLVPSDTQYGVEHLFYVTQ